MVVEGPKGCLRPRCFPATSDRGAGDDQTCPIFRLWQMAIPMQNATARHVKIWTRDFWKRAILSTDVLSHQMSSPLPQSHPKTPFWGNFQCKIEPIIHGALRKSHVNRAMKLKLYSYISIGKYLGEWGCVKIFSARGVRGGPGHINAKLGRSPNIISETTGARKLKLKTQLDVLKYSLRVQ